MHEHRHRRGWWRGAAALDGACAVALASVAWQRAASPRVWGRGEVPVAFWTWRDELPADEAVEGAAREARAGVLFARAGQLHAEGARRQWHGQLARRGVKAKPAGETLREVWAAARDAVRAAGYGATRAGGHGAQPAPVAPWLHDELRQTRLELRVHKLFHAGEMFLRATSRALWHYVSPLTHDARGRRAPATNAVAHAILFALLTTLVRLLYAG